MGLFSRRRPAEDPAAPVERPAAESDSVPKQPDDGRGSSRGPWDVAEVSDLGPRLDLGSLRVPGRPGMQLRMELDPTGKRAVAAHLALGPSGLQVQAFAAPRTAGIWDELRSEIANSVTRQGGTADEVTGPFGPELLARLPVRTPEGRTGHRPTRFIGIDGPRWFVRGVLTGQGAVEPDAAAELEGVLADLVVVRGPEARPPRDLLPLRLPESDGDAPSEEGSAARAQEILERGPEITEIR